MRHVKDPLLYLDTSIIYHNTVNIFIPSERANVQHGFNLVKKICRETLIIKTDIEDALRIVPIYPSSFSWFQKIIRLPTFPCLVQK